MKSIHLLIVILLFHFVSYSQNLSGEYFVISTTGLNFRDAPKTDSNILFTIPFGTKIQVIDKESYGIDTIGSYEFKYFDDEESYKTKTIGNWVKVNYKNKIGYLFDAYLYRHFKGWKTVQYAEEPNLNEEFVLLFPGSWCNYNFWFRTELNWYGYYQEGKEFKIKKVDLSFFKDWNGDLTDIGISTNNNIGLLFIIGSKIQLSEGEINGKYNRNWWTRSFEEYPNIEIRKGQNCNKLFLITPTKEQLLNSHHKNYYSPSSILWEGDLDNDGILDYIIHYGGKSGKTYLYLSSKADNDQIVKPVAVFFSGYCC